MPRAAETSAATSPKPSKPASLEDGRKFKFMKRHLSGLGMTPADHCAKRSLPHDYPMMSPGEAVGIGRTISLGRRDSGASMAEPTLEAAQSTQPEPEAAAPTSQRGQAKKLVNGLTDSSYKEYFPK